MRDEVKPLHLRIDVSDLPAQPQTPLKLLTSQHQHVFSIVENVPGIVFGSLGAKAALEEPSELLTFLTCWNNDATARRRV